MHRRALLILATVALIATACTSITTPAVDYGTGSFFPFVVDSQDNMGQGNAVALTSDGLPFVSYFGFAAKLAEGQIAIPRPFGAPNVPGVMLSTASSDGLWQRGAIEMEAYPSSALTPLGVSVPFGPATTTKLDLTPGNTNGTAIAVDDQGAAHVAWTSSNTVSYGTSSLGGSATVDRVFSLSGAVTEAGPIGRPGIALDEAGTPWIAFTVESNKGLQVHVAALAGSKWSDRVVATVAGCNGCPSPQPTGIGFVGGTATVVYADPSAKRVVALTQQGNAWTPTTVASGVTGFGLSFAAASDTASAAFYTGDGAVDAASLSQGSWKVDKVDDVTTDPDATVNGGDASSTAVAVAGDGTRYVAYDDEGIHLSSGTDTFQPVDIGSTASTGIDPSLTATDQGAVALGWYDTLAQNQVIAFVGNVTGIVVARPSPSLTVSQGPASPSGSSKCGQDNKVQLDQVAQGTLFTEPCLVAAPGQFTVNFDNKDVNIPHNFAVLASAGGKVLDATEVKPGPDQETLPLDLKAGSYYFECQVHPDVMFGTLAVVDGAK
jgi:plastocyanin